MSQDATTSATPDALLEDLLRRVDGAAERHGTNRASIIRRATGNVHMPKRIEGKAADLTSVMDKIERFLETLDREADDGQERRSA